VPQNLPSEKRVANGSNAISCKGNHTPPICQIVTLWRLHTPTPKQTNVCVLCLPRVNRSHYPCLNFFPFFPQDRNPETQKQLRVPKPKRLLCQDLSLSSSFLAGGRSVSGGAYYKRSMLNRQGRAKYLLLLVEICTDLPSCLPIIGVGSIFDLQRSASATRTCPAAVQLHHAGLFKKFPAFHPFSLPLLCCTHPPSKHYQFPVPLSSLGFPVFFTSECCSSLRMPSPATARYGAPVG